jgi:hypothetical protein
MLRRNTCRNIRDLIPLHAGGDLTPEESARVDTHLHACLPCYREFREHAEMRGRLGVLAEEPLPAGLLDGFAEEVMARIAVDAGGPAAELPSTRRWTLQPVVLRQAAAAAVLLTVGGWMAWQADLLRGAPRAPDALPAPMAGSARTEVVFPEGYGPLTASTRVAPTLPLHVPDFSPISAQSAGNPGPRHGLEHLELTLHLLPDGNVLQLVPAPGDPTGLMPVPGGLVPEPGRERRLRDEDVVRP